MYYIIIMYALHIQWKIYIYDAHNYMYISIRSKYTLIYMWLTDARGRLGDHYRRRDIRFFFLNFIYYIYKFKNTKSYIDLINVFFLLFSHIHEFTRIYVSNIYIYILEQCVFEKRSYNNERRRACVYLKYYIIRKFRTLHIYFYKYYSI